MHSTAPESTPLKYTVLLSKCGNICTISGTYTAGDCGFPSPLPDPPPLPAAAAAAAAAVAAAAATASLGTAARLSSRSARVGSAERAILGRGAGGLEATGTVVLASWRSPPASRRSTSMEASLLFSAIWRGVPQALTALGSAPRVRSTSAQSMRLLCAAKCRGVCMPPPGASTGTSPEARRSSMHALLPKPAAKCRGVEPLSCLAAGSAP